MIACMLIHGYTGGPYEVQPLADYLNEKTNWQIYVPTLPGHGETLELDDMTYDEWLTAVEDLFQELNNIYETIYIIGFSMGGMIAGYLAGKYAVDKLVLLAAARKYISVKHMVEEVGDVITDAIKGQLTDNEFYTNFRKKRESVPLRANFEFTKLVRYTKPYLKKINVPVLIAQGQNDPVVPAKSIDYLNKEIKSEVKEVVLFDQSEHRLCLASDKDVLNELVYNFLAN
ncbi:MAG TPA: alpha/beta fold hydrolase [Bacillota bacterium]|nr:alpha/beta fold hydrolase [Bacillota bacterium]